MKAGFNEWFISLHRKCATICILSVYFQLKRFDPVNWPHKSWQGITIYAFSYGLKLHTYIYDKSAEDGLIFKASLFHNKQVGSSVSPIKAVLSTHNQLYYTSCDHIQKPMTQSCVPVLKIFGHGINSVQPIMLGLSSTNQVHSLLPRYTCKGLTYLWSTDLLDTRTFLNMKESIP